MKEGLSDGYGKPDHGNHVKYALLNLIVRASKSLHSTKTGR